MRRKYNEEEAKEVDEARKKDGGLTLMGRFPEEGSSINSIDLRMQKVPQINDI